MTTFDDEFADAFTDLLDEFGETVGYYANGTPSVSMPEVEAIVNRGTVNPTALGRASQVTTGLVIDVAVADVATVTVGLTSFELAERSGGTARRYTVREVMRQVGGVWRLRLA